MRSTAGNFNMQPSSNTTMTNFNPLKTMNTNLFRKTNTMLGEIDNIERLAMKKRIENKTFYKTDNFTKTKKSVSVSAKKTVKANTEYGPFLNINSKTEKIEIKNKFVKDLVEECNNFGPFYSHCPSCNNRNLSFYQNMNSDHALKLLTFIRDHRLKSSKS